MGILKYKYKAHKFINYAFYIVVFIIGYLLGFGSNKLDFSKLISQFLMIDSASAYTLYERTTGSYPITIDEDYILEKIALIDSDFDFESHSNVICVTNTVTNSKWTSSSNYAYNPDGIPEKAPKESGYKLDCYFIPTDSLNQLTTITYNSSNHNHIFNSVITGDIKKLSIMLGTASVALPSTGYMLYETLTSLDKVVTYAKDGPLSNNLYTNFDFDYSKIKNELEFKQFVDLKFNENLFKDNPDFKEVCVNVDSRFSITSNEITYNDETGLKFFNGIDFIWFSYVPDGLSTYLYSSKTDTKVTVLKEDGPLFNGINPGMWYYLDEQSEIDKFFNTDSSKGEIYPGTQLYREGYINKYSYFGWYFHPFVVHLDNSTEPEYTFNVFHFKDNINFYSILENGVDHYEELENARNGNICFYIKNSYDVTILDSDIFNDDIGEVTILGGDKLDINTSNNVSNLNSKGLFSKINLFISHIKDTIVFVNNYIYDLFVSMPYIVQLFIISILGLIVVKILVGMVTK